MSLLNLIRWKNLLMIALTQCLIKYILFSSFKIDITLNHLDFILLVLSTICIAASGNIINDIYDVETDAINKPEKVIIGHHISEKTGFTYFIIFSVIGVGLGFYISNSIGKSQFSSIFVIISALLYIYASYLKQTFLIGNIVISALVAMSIIIVGLFELLPAVTFQNQQLQISVFKIVLEYALFAFMMNFLREIVKDIQDIEGDYKLEMKTLPIIIGRDRATKVVFGLSIISLMTLIYYITLYLFKHIIAVGYFVFLIVGPLLYFTIKIVNAETKKELQIASNLLKIVMFTGILSILLYSFI